MTGNWFSCTPTKSGCFLRHSFDVVFNNSLLQLIDVIKCLLLNQTDPLLIFISVPLCPQGLWFISNPVSLSPPKHNKHIPNISLTSPNRNPEYEYVSSGHIDYYELEYMMHYRQLLKRKSNAAHLCYNITSTKPVPFSKRKKHDLRAFTKKYTYLFV